MRILIAEDERITRTTLSRQLVSWGHNVTSAEDGQQAWELFGTDEFDIIITDWEMPRLSGPELVARVRQAPRAIYTYVIILTSRSNKSDVVEGIEAGADDYVSKPFDREELRVRLLAGQRIVELERALHEHNAQLRDANERIRSGLRAAARVQQSMLPQQNIVTPCVRTGWKYVPTDELAGDAIGLHLIDDRYLVAYVLDVSGHGVPAALLSVTAMNALAPVPPESSLLRDTGGTGLGTVKHPATVAGELNRRFRSAELDGRYLTMVLCVLDTTNGQVHMTSAGHPAPLIMRGSESIDAPDAGGLPIAMFDSSEYEEGCIQLQAGDHICLYSDGVIEQTGRSDDQQFDIDRLRQSLISHEKLDPRELVLEVVNDLASWAGGCEFTDDVSIVSVEWLGCR